MTSSASDEPSLFSSIARADPESEEILQALKIFASLKENDRISTSGSFLTVHRPGDKLVWLKRLINNESRTTNFDYLEKRFRRAFEKIDEYLKTKDSFMTSQSTNPTQSQMLCAPLIQLQNQQKILRLCRAIKAASDNISKAWKTTYEQDSAALCRLANLSEDIQDKLAQVDLSVQLLDRKQKSLHHPGASSSDSGPESEDGDGDA
jgi:hypothetical protein